MYTPALPLSGLAGWRFLERTDDRQREAFANSAEIKRNVDYFREKAGEIETIDEFFADRRILEVTLGAFGLQDEIDKRAFLRKVVEEGIFDDGDFANRLQDDRYARFAQAVGFGDDIPYLLNTTNARERIIEGYLDQMYEVSLGNVDTNMRLAANFTRQIADIATDPAVESAGWFKVLGRADLREVLDTALNLPTEFAAIDLDQQREVIEEKMFSLIGSRSAAALADPANVDKLIERFFLFKEIEQGPSANTPGMAALTILQSGFSGAGGANLFQSLL